jgi:rhodanese-related sulfurtransferase
VSDRDRRYKNAVYEQFALVGKALCSGPRLELLDVLLQADRTVEVLAHEAGLSVANASHHLQVLKRSGLVEAERRGQYVAYSIADPAVRGMVDAIRSFGERRHAEIGRATTEYLADRERVEAMDRGELLARVSSGACVVLDVRPPEEYAAAHVAGAVSMPLDELERRLAELPKDRQIVAHCRGPYCVLAVNAVEALRRHGYDAVRATEDVEAWRSHGLAIVTGPQEESA